MFYWEYEIAKSRTQRITSKEVASSLRTAWKQQAKRASRTVVWPPSPSRATMGFRLCVALKKGL